MAKYDFVVVDGRTRPEHLAYQLDEAGGFGYQVVGVLPDGMIIMQRGIE